LSRGQIQNCLPGDEISDFAVTSSKDDWGKRAMNLFDSQKYAQAKDSFMRANNPRMTAVANAYVLQEEALKMLSTTKTRPAAFESAAQAFLACARDARESGSDKYKVFYQLAAKCLEEAGNIIKAAENYRIAEKFTKAAILFRKSGKFDDAYDIINNYSDKVTPDDKKVLESVKDVIRLHYLGEKKYQ
jgi:tetratricopeptide (TPR) repeat protein